MGIKDLIAKLEADAKAESDEKVICDKHMKEATTTRDNANMDIEAKAADLAKNQATKAQLLDEIRDLEKTIAENKKAEKEAIELWAKEKADNMLTLNMADQGVKSVDFALATLAEFYGGTKFIETGEASS